MRRNIKSSSLGSLQFYTFRDETLVRFTEDGEKEDLIITLREKDEDIYDFLQDELKIFYKICAQMESKLNQ